MLTNTRVEANKIRCPWIEGYCSRTSVKAGETIEIKVSTNPPAKFTLDLYRLGYYGGKGGRLMERLPAAARLAAARSAGGRQCACGNARGKRRTS